MITKLAKKIARSIRRFIGVERVLEQQDQLKGELLQLKRELMQLKGDLVDQGHRLDRAASYLEFSVIDDKRMRESSKFQNLHEIILLLSPMDIIGAKYRRVGRDCDGGYIMLDDSLSNIDAAYSFGIADDVSWDEEIAELGIHVYMYDHTIKNLPKQHSRFHFLNEGVTGNPGEEGLETLSNLIARNGHQELNNLLLKMDIEGCEWSVFDETPSGVIGQFSQIVIELHGLDPSVARADLSKVLSVLQKINKTHQSIHVHANGFCKVSWLGDLALPHLLEVTYVRRADYADRFVKNTRTFPTRIDQPTYPWLPDVSLGTFSTTRRVE